MIYENNPAIALRTILRRVMQGNAHINVLWVEAFGAEIESVEFSLRHSEVVALWRRVHDLLESLPHGEERDQYLSYMGHYYNAIVSPLSWSDAVGSQIANSLKVDHLSGIATTLNYRAITAPVPSDAAIDRLRQSIADWRDILNEANFEEKFAAELRSQVNHLEWLLEHMELFGAAPVAEQSKKITGNSLIAMTKRPSYAVRIGAATAAMLAFVTAAHETVDETTGLIEGITQMQEAYVKLVSPPKEIEAPKTKKLPAAPESPTPEAQG